VAEQLQNRAKESGRPYRYGVDPPPKELKVRGSSKGKGKAKETEVVTLSSDDDDDEEGGGQSQSRRQRSLSGEISSPERSGEEGEDELKMKMPGSFTEKPVLPKNNRRHLQPNRYDDPSSDDLAMKVPPPMRMSGSANGIGSGERKVQEMVGHWEEIGGGGSGKGKQKASVASSLAPRVRSPSFSLGSFGPSQLSHETRRNIAD